MVEYASVETHILAYFTQSFRANIPVYFDAFHYPEAYLEPSETSTIACNFIKKKPSTDVFLQILRYFKSTFFTEQIRTTASLCAK